jgi:hypothetical protein
MTRYIAIFDGPDFSCYDYRPKYVIQEKDLQFRPCTNRGNGWVPREPTDFIGMITKLSEQLGVDLNEPSNLNTPECICPETCDCQNPEAGLKSNNCPVHNEDPCPNPDCTADLHKNSLTDTLAENYARICGAKCARVEQNSYTWSTSKDDLSVWFSPNEEIIIGFTKNIDQTNANPCDEIVAVTSVFELADPQLEDKLGTFAAKIRNAS